MNSKILKVLEFNKIQNQLLQQILTASGAEKVRVLLPVSDVEKVSIWLQETKEGLDVERLRGGFPLSQIEDMKPLIKRLEVGANLNGVELAQISQLLRLTSEIMCFINDLKAEHFTFARLFYWQDKLTVFPKINQKLRLSIAGDGSVNDEASLELQKIRKRIHHRKENIQNELNRLIQSNLAKYLSDALITIRSDHYVLPVKQEYRKIFGGIVHDQSATGQTLYIEPKQVVEWNNHLRQYQAQERLEIERILAELSALLSPYTKEILQNDFVLGQLDFIQAKARLAKMQKSVIPNISAENKVKLRQARHPLMDHTTVVPNDLVIGKDYQTLVITGPNTGGKTITLKTFGLLQIMAQSGLAISALEDSTVGVFNEIFADIGDEQSIEQNLSTFSSHMTNIVAILKAIDDKSLVLFDELGAGTDPQEGSVLAITILDAVQAKGSYVMATTHYPELKAYGYNRAHTINASMEFDVKTLSPTYRLLIGVPGRSNAFDIAKRLGLDEKIITEARSLIDKKSQKIDKMVLNLEKQRKIAEIDYLLLHKNLEKSENLLLDLQKGYQNFLKKREKELEKAYNKANNIIKEAKEKSDKIIQKVRKMQKNANHSVIKEHELIAAKSQLNNLQREREFLSKNKVLQKVKKLKDFKIGDEVIVTTYGQRGILVEKRSAKEWVVQIGLLKMTVSLEQLDPVKPDKQKKAKITHIKPYVRSSSYDFFHSVNTQLDVRGKRYEDALIAVDRYLDQALLASLLQVTIVHGKGTGVLCQGIRKMLRLDLRVKNFDFTPENAGGAGVTIVKLE
ncbi:MAG: endonuclease MutS2 [Streptococcaceae bacterium]|jgi:DNA mismatch repair protein MutS2|nr:endonuclease MutS2 [Streptococcaceae bacterium]